MPDAPVLDESIVDGLRRLGDDVVTEILRLWFDNLEPTLDAMRSALAADTRPGLVAAAHSLRGSAANVGAARLAAACATLEMAAKDGTDPAALRGLLTTVEAESVTAKAAMSAVADGTA